MAAHISQDVLDGKKIPAVRTGKNAPFQPARGATREELAAEYARSLLPSVRSRLICRDEDGRMVP